ncbi:hypothetical protein [Sodalis sp. dw_96]|uniref:hypothetical protein n=1 Tax=Sodalis sp. dw_96 TaxID=2719794 RepID=UPI0021054499|nr:hypothetical protein [Sodalis sp. dw_96]
MSNKITVILAAVIVLLLGATLYLSLHYYGKYQAQVTANTVLVRENKAADAAMQNQTHLITIFNTLAGTTINAQANNNAAGQDREVVIQTLIKTEPCAGVAVPAAAGNVLLDHYHQLRESTDDSPAGQPDGSLPAVAAAK